VRRIVDLYPVEESSGKSHSKVAGKVAMDTVRFPAAQLAGMLSSALVAVTRGFGKIAPEMAVCHYRGQRQMPDLPLKIAIVRLQERLICCFPTVVESHNSAAGRSFGCGIDSPDLLAAEEQETRMGVLRLALRGTRSALQDKGVSDIQPDYQKAEYLPVGCCGYAYG
jgi:hypothetical protein